MEERNLTVLYDWEAMHPAVNRKIGGSNPSAPVITRISEIHTRVSVRNKDHLKNLK